MIPLPTDRGASAAEYLRAHGIVAKPGKIRASDYELAANDPFLYYLRIRLGLTSPFTPGDALSHGTWFHRAHEFLEPGGPLKTPPAAYLAAVRRTADDLAHDLSSVPGISSTRIEAAKYEEMKRALEAWVWYYNAMTLPLPGGSRNALNYLSAYTEVGREVLIRGTQNEVVQIDDLRYDPRNNTIEPFDLKTCSTSVSQRLAACPIEFQTQLYSYVIREDLARPVSESTIKRLMVEKGIPVREGLSLGAFHHLAVRKPTIRFGQNDRPFKMESKILKSGPRKGQTVLEKVYEGVPTVECYINRCHDWYAGTGDFLDQAEDRKADPVVNISTVRSAPLSLDPTNPNFDYEFDRRVQLIYRYSGLSPQPHFFPRSTRNLLDQSENSVYTPFYLQPVREWPSIIRDLGLVQRWRDPEPETLRP